MTDQGTDRIPGMVEPARRRFGWPSAPRWARVLLVTAAVVFAACVLTVKPHALAAQH
jgi:hypothetical protein